MAERDRAAVDVDLAGVPAEVLVDRAGLRREGLVRLDQIEVLDLPARLLERRARGRDRAGAHDRRIDAGMRPGHDAGERLLPRLAASLAFISTTAAAPSLMPEALAGRHGALLVEGRPQLADRLERGAVLADIRRCRPPRRPCAT